MSDKNEQATISKLEHQLAASTLNSVVMYLTEQQQTAIRGKIHPNDVDTYLKETPGNSDVLVAYLVFKARNEANDRLFSLVKNSLQLDLVRWYRGTISTDESVMVESLKQITAIAEPITRAQRIVLLEGLKKDLLKGRTAMDKDTETAFITTVAKMGVDPKSVR